MDIDVAYVTHFDVNDVQVWSGTVYYMDRALQSAGLPTKCIDNLRDRYWLPTKAKKAVYSKLLGKAYLRDREPLTLRSYARQAEGALSSMDCDVVLSPGTLPIAYLRTDKPVVFWTDTTFAGVVDNYPPFSNLCRETLRNGHRTDQLALSRCRLAIYSSPWAADTALRHYDVDASKVKVVPFGANIRCNRDTETIRRIADDKAFDRCRLLFMGVDWFRKGGDVALDVARYLNRRGLRTELHVVGCQPPREVPPFVTLHGYISKKTEEGRRVLDRLFRESHFLILPSRAECFGMVLTEACSFGLPAVATRIHGIPGIIRDDRNGRMFPLDEAPGSYSDYIAGLMSCRRAYTELALSSFEEYSERLNWWSSGIKVRELIAQYCL